jgi:hypothetical protein
MLRRLGLGPASGPRVLGLAAAAGLVVAVVVTGRSLRGLDPAPPTRSAPPAPVAAPYRIGGRPACPLTYQVMATADGRSYPAGHPVGPPRDADPVACYGSAAEATAAGYPPAPLPAGVLELDGVYLVPTSAHLRRRCRQAAGRLGFAVPCPTLRPAPSGGAPPPTVHGDPGAGFLFEDSGFLVPSGYVGAYPEVGARLVVGATERPAAPAVACPGQRPVAVPTRVRGRLGGLFRCPLGSGPHRDALLLRWRERGTVLALSVTGDSGRERRLVLALAAHLELVRPGDRLGPLP